jgi:phytanoyl-CoA hydroxylase
MLIQAAKAQSLSLFKRVSHVHYMTAFTLKRSFSKLGRDGDNYIIPPNAAAEFQENGYIVLKDFVTEEEILDIEKVYNAFMRREIPVPGRDLCDMSDATGKRTFDQYSIINVMLPTRYAAKQFPEFCNNNIYERRAANVMKQLFPNKSMQKDYDQLLDKNPMKSDAVFAWHQDMAYWPGPNITPDTTTATFSLALDNTRIANGCLRFIPGSQKQKKVFPHVPIGKNRDESHTIAVDVDETKENIVNVEINRRDVTVHCEYVVHGSGPNMTESHRRTYVVAYRTEDTVKRERALGFSHSHNDQFNWNKFNDWENNTASQKRN